MKKILTLLSAMLLGVCLVTTGCKTPTGTTPPTQEQKLEKASILLKGTVRSALVLVLDKNGDDAKPYIALARHVISELAGGDDFTPGKLLLAIEGLPSEALGRSEVKLAISAIVTAYEIYYGDYVRDQVNGNAHAKTLLMAIRDGCDEALRLGP